MPMDEGLHQFTAIQLIVVVSVMHFEIMKLEFLFCHFAGINRNSHMLSNMTRIKIETIVNVLKANCVSIERLTLSREPCAGR